MAAPTLEEMAAKEAKIKQLVEEEQRDEAGKLLFDLLVACAQGGDFNNANRLRDMLYDVDPMALTSVIKANEIIDNAMSGAISDTFTDTWTTLQEFFSEDEFLALYHAIQEHQLTKGKVLVKAGAKLDAIFFITTGNINLISRCGNKNCAVKILGPGTMIGENCFQPSFWTVSLVSLQDSTLSILRAKQLQELEDRFPGFENKLLNFYQQFDDIPKLLEEQDLHRRCHPRAVVSHKMVFQVQAADGKLDERSFRGELDNISRGGLAFLLRIVKREKRRMLFGRRLQIIVPAGTKKKVFVGVVVAVTIHDFQSRDYALHVAFDKVVSEEMIQELLPMETDEDEQPFDLIDDGSAKEQSPDKPVEEE